MLSILETGKKETEETFKNYSKMGKTKIALIQMKMSSDLKSNLSKSIRQIRIAKKKGAKIVCLPELFISKYFCQTEKHSNFKLAEKIPGPTTKKLSLISRELKIILIIPIFEKRTSGVYHNSCVVINEKGSIIGKYRKMHIPDDPQYYEKFYFTPGDLGYKSFKTKEGNLGVLICWDQWFPEAARLTAIEGANIIFYPTAIGWHTKEKRKYGKSQLNSWLSIQRSHAISNGVFVAAINRVGIEKDVKKKIEFWGNSIVYDPSGNIITKAGGKEKILLCELDFKTNEKVRQHWPFFRDRRIDSYKGILKNPKDA